MSDPTPSPATSFGAVADAYDRARPSYPDEAVAWLTGGGRAHVVELGAGTGKLTEMLIELGHDVFATEPDEQMLDLLSAKLPDARATVGSAEEIPVGDQTYDAVIVGQAFHWFDQEAALAEISRVLKPGGRLIVLWNERDNRIPWVRKLSAQIASQRGDVDPTGAIDDSALYSAVEEHDFRFWQIVNRETIQDLVMSNSHVSTLPEEQREAKRRDVLALYDDYGRGMDGMQLPYTCRVFRTVVLEHARRAPEPAPAPPSTSSSAIIIGEPVSVPSAMHDTAMRLPRVVVDGTGTGVHPRPPGKSPGDPDGDDLVLIDFR